MLRARNSIFRATILVAVLAVLFVKGTWGDEGWLDELRRESCPGRIQVIEPPSPFGDMPTRPVLKTVHGDYAIDVGLDGVLSEGRGPRHLLVCLRGAVSTPFRHLLEKRGIRLLQYLPENCWRASVSEEGIMATMSDPEICAVRPFCVPDKLPAKILAEGPAPRSWNFDGSVSLVVTFFADVDFGAALRVLERIGATTHQREFLTGFRVQVTLPARLVPELVHADEVSWIDDRPSPALVENEDAAALSRIDEVQAPPLNLDGSGIRIGEWDAGEVQAGHQDFGGRVVVVDHSSVNSHSTHVAGTLMGDGSGDPAARGMAPGAQLYSYDFNGDELAEMVAAAATVGISVSSNSWGYIGGWHANWYNDGYQVWFGDEAQGAYNGNAQAWDQTVVATGLLISKSAGNDRDDFGDKDQTGHHHYPDGTTLYTDYHPPDGPWDCVGDIASAKDVITVGALMDNGDMTEFSAWGPCDDGRIKPDITANGYGLWSTCPADTYCSKTGTSMSTPVVGGAMALIAQQYTEMVSSDGPSVHLMKALLANTAIDIGNPGPDYSNGWGLLDAKNAVDLLSVPGSQVEVGLVNGMVDDLEIEVTENTDELRVTAAWTDPPGDPLAAHALVNNVDLRLVSPSAFVHLPWVLDPGSPSAAATRGINLVDNVEQVVVEDPEPGLWTVRLVGSSIQESQKVALVSTVPFPDLLGDGFESGDTSAWYVVVTGEP